MKQEYTRGEIADLLAALRQVFSTVRLADAASGAVLGAEPDLKDSLSNSG